MPCNLQTISLPCFGKVLPSLEPVTFSTNINYRSRCTTKPVACVTEVWAAEPLLQHKPFTQTLSTVSNDNTLSTGKFGSFGGKFVAEVLIAPLAELETVFKSILNDHEFKMELTTALRDYVGRETPLYHAQNFTDHYRDINGEGPEIYLKREDLNHGGSYKMNNVIAQAILAKRMGRKRVITASAGNHGVSVASVCAKFSLHCTIFIGTDDMKRNPSNVQVMTLLGAQVKPVDGSFQEAASESTREWIENLETSYYLSGTAVGPHPIPTMVREFNSVIGKETRRQAMEKWGGKPDVLVACVGSGCNALGLFYEFVADKTVRMIGVEGGGVGTNIDEHSASLVRGEVGVYHGAMCYVIQDKEGQITKTQSVATGLKFPGVSPELSFLKDAGRVECYTVTDQEALDAYKRLCRLEGIIPALEASHALSYLEKLCPTLRHGSKVVVNCSGTGYNDITTLINTILCH